MRILIIQPSHLGDIILVFPALTDAKRHLPQAQFDWAVKERFLEVPRLHPAVHKVLSLKQVIFSQTDYDIVIDNHGMIKTAILSCLTKTSLRVGPSSTCAREKLAAMFYQKRVNYDFQEHATLKARILFSQALSYELPATTLDYGIDKTQIEIFECERPYWFFLHGTSRQNKQWPESHWIDLAKWVSDQGFQVRLLWGNELERQRALRIQAAVSPQSVWVAATRLALKEVASLLLNARQVVGLDTGLTHLCAALGVKTLSLYASYDPKYFGNVGENQSIIRSSLSCSPCSRMKCRLEHNLLDSVPCLEAISLENIIHSIRDHGCRLESKL